MKITILNGSPRKGNTLTAIRAFVEGAEKKNEIEIIDTNKLKIKACQGCDSCECSKGCVANDDTNEVIDKLVASDMILFASPVYWWGVTAQLKLVIDKAYCKAAFLKNKKIGVIAIGGSSVDNLQYKLIDDQFKCIAEYLSWEIIFSKSYSAYEPNALQKDAGIMEELRAVGESKSLT